MIRGKPMSKAELCSIFLMEKFLDTNMSQADEEILTTLIQVKMQKVISLPLALCTVHIISSGVSRVFLKLMLASCFLCID